MKHLLKISIIAILVILNVDVHAQTFTSGKIDDGDGCSWPFNSVAEAPNGDIYGFWRDGSGSSAVYKLIKWGGSSWTSVGSFNMTQVTASTPFDNASDDVSLAIDANGYYHVAFRGIENAACCGQERGICYGYSTNGTSWTFTNVDSYTDASGWKNLDDPIIKVDGAGNPHIVAGYRDANNSVVVGGVTYNRLYAIMHYKKTTTWSKQMFYYQGGASNEIGEISFDLDGSNLPHVAFQAENNGSGLDGNLIYIKNTSGTTWSTIDTLIKGGTSQAEGIYIDIEVDGSGDVYIVSNNYQGALKMTTNSSGSFATSTIRSNAYTSKGNFNITSGNHKFIGIYDGGSGTIKSMVQEKDSTR